MHIPFEKLDYHFLHKPLVVGGKAKEYYGLRKSGDDIDLVISKPDYENLKKIYPSNTVDLFGDLGIKAQGFELWTSITRFDYEFLSEGAIEQDTIKIISLEKLLFLTALAMDKPKYHRDLELIVARIMKEKYPDILI